VDLPLATGVMPTNDILEVDLQCPASLEGRRVLVVEDKADSRELLEIVFEGCKMQVVSVGSARAALLALDQERFDVIVSDIGLPNGEDGLVLMRLVRERPTDLGGRTPAIALTAYASATDRRQALAAGFQTYLAKPYEPTDLVAAVASLLSVQEPISLEGGEVRG
jgi:CheY-like chemotaxis protein